MLVNKHIAAKLAYECDRAVQATLDAPSLVKQWNLAQAAHETWIKYVSDYMQRGTIPTLNSEPDRVAVFTNLMQVIRPGVSPGKRAGATYTFDAAIDDSTLDISDMETGQITNTNTLDYNGDAVSGETFTYASSDETKATVSASGVVTPVGAGSVTITVTASSGATDTVAVTVQA